MAAHSFENILIVADIEGSSGCWSYRASSFRTPEWAEACLAMTLDVAAVTAALFESGARQVTIKDFHRTGYNLLPERIDSRAKVVSGYRIGPVPGIGDPRGAEAVLYVGLHAASGTGGHLAHTLTSRIARLEVNGAALPEVALFSASLAPFGVRPIFFSGCPTACDQARKWLPGIHTFSIDKSGGPAEVDICRWREHLAGAAVASLENRATGPYRPHGPFRAVVTMRDGEEAAHRLAVRWGLACRGSDILLEKNRFSDLYRDLIRICYLTPWTERLLGPAMAAFNLRGRLGLEWVRRRLAGHA